MEQFLRLAPAPALDHICRRAVCLKRPAYLGELLIIGIDLYQQASSTWYSNG